MMCGRYFLPELDDGDEYPKFRIILEELNRGGRPESAQIHGGEIFPSEIAPIIIAGENGFTVRPMRWGFPRIGGPGLVINSRSEKADVTPMFQKALREKRCLVPACGFYEWRRTPSGGKTKEKFAFSLGQAQQGEMMYLAGFYGEFSGGFSGGGYDGFVILTQAADSQMQPYHHRMPVILREEALKKAWLIAPHSFPYEEFRGRFSPPPLEISAS